MYMDSTPPLTRPPDPARFLIDHRWLARFHDYIGFDSNSPGGAAAVNPPSREPDNAMEDEAGGGGGGGGGPGEIDNRKLLAAELIGHDLEPQERPRRRCPLGR